MFIRAAGLRPAYRGRDMIEVRGVSHHYGVRLILRDVDLAVARGEVLALMGPNGMGKSTLMGVLGGTLAPARGTVTIDGRRRRGSPADERAIRRQVYYLPADPWLPRQLTGRAWLLAVGRVYGIDDERLMGHADRLLDLFDLARQGDAPIASYSTGQHKKLAVAGLLIAETPVMLLDEPFAGGLDPSAILALKKVLLRHAHGDDRTIVMATPVPELVAELADRIAILVDGRIVACGTLAELRARAGLNGPLDEVYERLVHPDGRRNVDRYFGEGASS